MVHQSRRDVHRPSISSAFARSFPSLVDSAPAIASSASFVRCRRPRSSDFDFIAELLDLLRQERDVAGSLVIDITQKGLGSLEAGRTRGTGMAGRARSDLLAVANRHCRPDVPALAHLGFQFLDIEASIIAKAAAASSPALRDAVLRRLRQSGEHGVSVLAAQVTHEASLRQC